MPKKKPVSEWLYGQLRDGITYSTFKPGERLNEKQLCEKYGVSRTPLREALRRLHAQGYITLNPRTSATVSVISLSEVDVIYNVLSLLEPYSAGRAAGKSSKKDIRSLQQVCDKMEEGSVKSDYRYWLRENDNFHNRIHVMGGSDLLSSTIRDIRNRVYRFRILITTINDIEKYNLDHRRIFDAIASGDGEKAQAHMRRHIMNAGNNRMRFLKNYPELL